MAVKIRLSRVGTTNRPFYRLVAVDERKKRDGAQLANIGTYDPINGSVIQFHEDIYKNWISKGALATDSAKKVYKLYQKNVKTVISMDKAVATTKNKKTSEDVA